MPSCYRSHTAYGLDFHTLLAQLFVSVRVVRYCPPRKTRLGGPQASGQQPLPSDVPDFATQEWLYAAVKKYQATLVNKVLERSSRVRRFRFSGGSFPTRYAKIPELLWNPSGASVEYIDQLDIPLCKSLRCGLSLGPLAQFTIYCFKIIGRRALGLHVEQPPGRAPFRNPRKASRKGITNVPSLVQAKKANKVHTKKAGPPTQLFLDPGIQLHWDITVTGSGTVPIHSRIPEIKRTAIALQLCCNKFIHLTTDTPAP